MIMIANDAAIMRMTRFLIGTLSETHGDFFLVCEGSVGTLKAGL